jgi:hypothetical protein
MQTSIQSSNKTNSTSAIAVLQKKCIDLCNTEDVEVCCDLFFSKFFSSKKCIWSLVYAFLKCYHPSKYADIETFLSSVRECVKNEKPIFKIRCFYDHYKGSWNYFYSFFTCDRMFAEIECFDVELLQLFQLLIARDAFQLHEKNEIATECIFSQFSYNSIVWKHFKVNRLLYFIDSFRLLQGLVQNNCTISC